MYKQAFMRLHQFENATQERLIAPCAYCGEVVHDSDWSAWTTPYSPSNPLNPNALRVNLCLQCYDGYHPWFASKDVREVVNIFAECWLDENPDTIPTNISYDDIPRIFVHYPMNLVSDDKRYKSWLEAMEATEDSLVGTRIRALADVLPGIVLGPKNSGGPGLRAMYAAGDISTFTF